MLTTLSSFKDRTWVSEVECAIAPDEILSADEVLSSDEVEKLEDVPNWVKDLDENEHVRLVGAVRKDDKDDKGFWFNTGAVESWVLKREVKRSANIGGGLVSIMLDKYFADYIGLI